MHFYNIIKDLSKDEEIILFVDMDGVISSFDVGKPLNFLEIRPLTENIKKLKKISKLPNVELHILSVCREDFQIDDKNTWLDKHAPFFKKENRTIISKEKLNGIKTADAKTNYLKEFKTEKKVVVIDDDNLVLKQILEQVENIIVFQDSELID